MNTLTIILARAGSKGLASKNLIPFCGRPLITHTVDHALQTQSPNVIALSTDSSTIATAVTNHTPDVHIVMRPESLATDTATIDSAARHALHELESKLNTQFDHVLILYGNIPLREPGMLDRALVKLQSTQCDSVQSVYPVGKNHPYWMKTLTGPDTDILEHYQPNNIYRRQDLPPVYMLDGALIAVTRQSLLLTADDDPHAFLGHDRRAIQSQPGTVIDIDEPHDLELAKAVHNTRTKIQPLNTNPFTLRNKTIQPQLNSPHTKPYIIAEIGVNHDGNVNRALDLTRQALLAGADAIKLQLFDPDLLLSTDAELAQYQQNQSTNPTTPTNPQQLLSNLALKPDEIADVRNLAHELNLGFILTPFSLELFDTINALDVDAVKIASPDCINLPLIQTMSQLNKPMLISLGTITDDEYPILQHTLQTASINPLALMHCVSAYPVPKGQADLHGITRIAKRFALPTGYSDHTTQLNTGMLAVASGACVIEKHLTHNRNAPGPDHAASFDPDQFAQYVHLIHQAHAEIHTSTQSQRKTQADVKRVSRQSLCTTRDLPAGHTLTRQDLTVKRPGTGIPAYHLQQLIGHKLTQPLAANHILHWDHVDTDPNSIAPLTTANAPTNSATQSQNAPIDPINFRLKTGA